MNNESSWRGAAMVALVVVLSASAACSSTSATTANGTGGAGGVAVGQGGASGAAGADAGADTGTDAPGTPFPCGDTTCITGQTYCRARAGQFNPDSGTYPATYLCRPFICSPANCSCVLLEQGDTYCQSSGCHENDAGAVTLGCGAV